MNREKTKLTVLFICASVILLSGYFDSATGSENERRSFKKLVILPLENLGKSSKELDSIGQEMALSLMQSLAQVKELSVIDPSSVRSYILKKLEFVEATGAGDEDALKKQLDDFEKADVDLLLRGNYRVIGKEIKVTVQVLDATSGELKVSPVSIKDTYPDSLFAIEEKLAEKAAFSISSMFESYYKDFESFYKFTTDREAYRLYLRGVDAKSDQTIKGYANAIQYFYEAYKKDNSFLLAFYEMKKLQRQITDNLRNAAESDQLFAMLSDSGKSADVFGTLDSLRTGPLAGIMESAINIENKFRLKHAAEYTTAYQNYKNSTYYCRGENAAADAANFPNDIETLLFAWEQTDSFKPESKYRKRIIAINSDYLPLKIVDFFNELKREQDASLAEPKKRFTDYLNTNIKYYNAEKYISDFDKIVKTSRVKIDLFNKINPEAKYSTLYLIQLKVFISLCLSDIELKMEWGFHNLVNADKEMDYISENFAAYTSMMKKELGKLKVK